MTKFLFIALAVFGLSACQPRPVPAPLNPVAPACGALINPRPISCDLRLDPGSHLPPRVELPFQ